ncbi:hypothetical protein BDV10DRAFT_176161 [Aspergillus recurvatus]
MSKRSCRPSRHMRHRLRSRIGRWPGGLRRRDWRDWRGSGGRIFECTWWRWMVLRLRGRVGLGRSAGGGAIWVGMVFFLVDVTTLCNGYGCAE